MREHRFGKVLQNVWDWRAAGNFMFGGTGSGLLFLVALFSYPQTPPLTVGLIALFFVAAGLTLVWLEIGRPWRFLNVYFNPWTSWMTREAFVAALLFALALIGVVFQLPVIILLAGITALFFLYCQARILKASKGVPAWREASIVPLILVTGLAEGAGVLAIIQAMLGVINQWLISAFILLLMVRIIAWFNYRRRLVEGNAPEGALAELLKINSLTLVAGNLAPLALLVAGLLSENVHPTLQVLAGGLALLSGWLVKFVIVTRAAHYQGFSLVRPKRTKVAGT